MTVMVEAPKSIGIEPETRRQILIADKVEGFVRAYSSAARDEDDPNKAETIVSILLDQLRTTPDLLDALLEREETWKRMGLSSSTGGGANKWDLEGMRR